jgi:hypothetical protein
MTLSARERRERAGQATQARLSARYSAVLETAAQIWEMRKAESRRDEINAIVDELLQNADEDLRAYAKRRRADGGGFRRGRRSRSWRW